MVRAMHKAIDEAISAIGDDDNGPPPFYASIFEKLMDAEEECTRIAEEG